MSQYISGYECLNYDLPLTVPKRDLVAPNFRRLFQIKQRSPSQIERKMVKTLFTKYSQAQIEKMQTQNHRIITQKCLKLRRKFKIYAKENKESYIDKVFDTKEGQQPIFTRKTLNEPLDQKINFDQIFQKEIQMKIKCIEEAKQLEKDKENRRKHHSSYDGASSPIFKKVKEQLKQMLFLFQKRKKVQSVIETMDPSFSQSYTKSKLSYQNVGFQLRNTTGSFKSFLYKKRIRGKIAFKK